MFGSPMRWGGFSQKSLATLITKIIDSTEKYIRENPGANKPIS
jgi:hypothetical protein